MAELTTIPISIFIWLVSTVILYLVCQKERKSEQAHGIDRRKIYFYISLLVVFSFLFLGIFYQPIADIYQLFGLRLDDYSSVIFTSYIVEFIFQVSYFIHFFSIFSLLLSFLFITALKKNTIKGFFNYCFVRSVTVVAFGSLLLFLMILIL